MDPPNDPYCVQAMEQARAAWKQERDEIKEMCTKQHLWENGQEKDGSPKLAWKSSFLT